jgi:hypothetical protein
MIISTYQRLKLVLFLVFVAFAINGNAQNKQPIVLKYGLFIKKIVPNFKEGTFHAEFYWWLKFRNDTSVSEWTNDEILELEYTNACQFVSGSFKDEIQESKNFKDHNVYYSGYHQGDFYFNPDFTNYPFDEQVLNITIENIIIPMDQLVIQLDTASYVKSHRNAKQYGLSSDVVNNKSINFRINNSNITSSQGEYDTDFGDPEFPAHSKYSRLNVAITIDRSFVPFITKLIIPLAIILFLVYFVFYIPAEKIDIAAGLTVTSLLSAIAFQLSINSDIPEIGYIIYIDKVFYACYFLIAMAMAESLWTYYLDKAHEPKKVLLAARVDIIARILFPIIFLASLYIFAR